MYGKRRKAELIEPRRAQRDGEETQTAESRRQNGEVIGVLAF